ncbi:MAG: thioredoxin domain-containing protein [Candidatus Pacebacteria bacterium]|nr:thioredoxin domain-containing protein [Candidatus Paceibacterota bacterium]
MEENNKTWIAGAIIAGALIIAGAVIYTQNPNTDEQKAQVGGAGEENGAAQVSGENPYEKTPDINQEDHILGNPQAPVTIITYSDIECPFCKQFHGTMTEIMNTYGKEGKVKWVYRHLPLEALHPTAKKEAEATECAAELGGNEMFFKYLEALVNNTTAISESNADSEILEIADTFKIDKTKFSECLTSGRYSDKISKNITDAFALGIQGTPYSVVVSPNGERSEIPGALPLEQVKQEIDSALAK